MLFLAGLSLLSTQALAAGVCNNASLKGLYNFNFIETNNAAHDVGRINFNGKGGATVAGTEAAGGDTYLVSGSSTYSISASCILQGTIKWKNIGVTTTYSIYLDQMDTTPSVALAYRGNVIFKHSKNRSGSGFIERVQGKFQ